MPSFTYRHRGWTRYLISEVCAYSRAKPYALRDPDKDMDRRALWDTGASCTVIRKGLADVLGLKPVSVRTVATSQGKFEALCYYIDVYLPNGVIVPNLLVVEAQSDNSWDVLIGMDIIGQGDFAVSNFKGKTTFTFRIPSSSEIDFTENA